MSPLYADPPRADRRELRGLLFDAIELALIAIFLAGVAIVAAACTGGA